MNESNNLLEQLWTGKYKEVAILSAETLVGKKYKKLTYSEKLLAEYLLRDNVVEIDSNGRIWIYSE